MTGRKVLAEKSLMRIKTSRIGLLTVHATAPIIDGHLSDSALSFTVRIDEVNTGNPLLDPELHSLIHQITSGILTFDGQRAGAVYTGSASAGQITIPLSLSAHEDAAVVAIAGTSSFSDVHVPLPGMGHIRHLEIDIDGHLHLA